MDIFWKILKVNIFEVALLYLSKQNAVEFVSFIIALVSKDVSSYIIVKDVFDYLHFKCLFA